MLSECPCTAGFDIGCHEEIALKTGRKWLVRVDLCVALVQERPDFGKANSVSRAGKPVNEKPTASGVMRLRRFEPNNCGTRVRENEGE